MKVCDLETGVVSENRQGGTEGETYRLFCSVPSRYQNVLKFLFTCSYGLQSNNSRGAPGRGFHFFNIYSSMIEVSVEDMPFSTLSCEKETARRQCPDVILLSAQSLAKSDFETLVLSPWF